MKLVLCFTLAFVALATAERDWNKVFPKHIRGPIGNLSLYENINPRIVGGDEAKLHEFPYQAALFIETPRGTGLCGGSLISKRTVLTAAHCVDDAISVEVVLGAHNIRNKESSQKRFKSDKIKIHPRWNSNNLQNDVALIILPRAVSLNSNIKLVELPKSGETNKFVGSTATVSGWGRFSDDSQQSSAVLRKVSVPIINNSQCNLRYFGNIVDTHICAAGTGGKSTCNGDSGGPLVANRVQIGIVSFGISFGCEVGWPAVFARVTSYVDWITQHWE